MKKGKEKAAGVAKSHGPDAAHERLAWKKLEEIEEAEKAVNEEYERFTAARDELDATSARLGELREELRRIVEFCGGELHVPGLPRPLYVRTCNTVSYDAKRLLPWLEKHAPCYLREAVERNVDRRGLKRQMHIFGGRAYLPEVKSPVRGISIIETRQLVIPCRDGGSDKEQKESKVADAQQ